MKAKLRIGVAGAGAVGGHYGLVLQRAGCSLRFVARGEHLRAMQQHGLRHISHGVLRVEAVDCSDDLAILSDCDVIILACKMTQLKTMVHSLQQQQHSAALLVMQNGVEAAALLAKSFPDSPVIAASAFIGARIEPAGTILHSAAGHLRLAHYQGETQALMQQLCAKWQQAGTDAQIVADAEQMLWHKMLWNCGFNALTALTRRYARDIAADPACRYWVETAMREALAVAHAEGIALDEAIIEQHLQLTLHAGEVKTSMWQDVLQQRETEIDSMNGCICRLANQHGLNVPINTLWRDMIHALTQTEQGA